MTPITNAGPRAQKIARGVFINTANENCSIYESGRMVFNCIKESDRYSLDYFSLDMIDVSFLESKGEIRLVDGLQASKTADLSSYDFWVFNWHCITMGPRLGLASIEKLPGLKFTIVLEADPGDPLKLVPFDVFDGYIVLDPTVLATAKIFPFPRPLEGEPRNFTQSGRDVPVVGSFGFGTPGKGFELLVEAVNREFDRAVVRVNIPKGAYTSSNDATHRQEYSKYLASICKQIAKPGIDVRFTYEFMTPDELTNWCADNDLNCFLYTRRQPGLSATTDQAIMSGRPLLIGSNDTFRHIHRYIPPYPVIGLRQSIETTPPQVRKMQQDWSRASFYETFERMLATFGLFQLSATNGSASIAQARRATIMVASKSEVINADISSYATRLADSLGRLGNYNVVRVFFEQLSELQQETAKFQPSAAVVLGPPIGARGPVAAALKAVVGAKILLVKEDDTIAPHSVSDDGVLVLPRRPIIPYYTSSAALEDGPPRIWLIGFAARDSNLEKIVAKIAQELPEAKVILEVSVDDRSECDARVSRLRRLFQVKGLTLTVASLPSGGDEIISCMAKARLAIFYNDPERADELENICCLALATERPIVFTRASLFSCFQGRGTNVEDYAMKDIMALGIAAQIRLYHDFGEWQFYSQIHLDLEKSPAIAKLSPVPLMRDAEGPARVECLDSLFALDDEQFVQSAYWALLGRPPDPGGFAHYLALLNKGTPKIVVAGALLRSPEGRRYGSRLPGSRKAIWAHRLLTLPLLGPRPPFVGQRDGPRQKPNSPVGSGIENMLLLPDDEFLRAAYNAVLGRAADDEGFDHYLGLLQDGEDRQLILGSLRLSAEGRKYGADFPGLAQAVRRYRLLRSPVIGPVLRRAGWGRERIDFNHALRAIENKLHRLIEGRATAAVQNLETPAFHAVPSPVSSPPPSVTAAKRSRPTTFLLVGLAGNDGTTISRFLSRLGRAFLEQSYDIQLVQWSIEDEKLRLLTRDAFHQFGLPTRLIDRLASYPIKGGPPIIIERSSCGVDDWLLVPDLVGATADEPPLLTMDVIMESKRLGMRSSFIFHGAEPLRSRKHAGGPADAYEQHMQALLLADIIMPISNIGANDLYEFFTQYQKAESIPLINKIIPHVESEPYLANEWSNYVRRLRGLLSEAAKEAHRLTAIYYLIDAATPPGEAISPFSRSLARALTEHGVDVIPVLWDGKNKQLIAAKGEHLCHGARLDGQRSYAEWIEPGGTDAPRWVLHSDGVRAELLEQVASFAKTKRLRTAAILQDAILHDDEKQLDGFSARERRSFEVLATLDKVLAVSEGRLEEYQRFLLSWRGRVHSAEHRFKAIISPNEIPGQGRRVVPKRAAAGVIGVLIITAGDRSIDLGTVLDAAVTAAKRSADRMIFTLIGSLSASSASQIETAEVRLKFAAELQWQRECGGERLNQVFDEADFAVYTGVDGENAAPVLESLWRGLPCLVHRRDTGSVQPGIEFVNMRNESELAAAILKLTDNQWRHYLANEAITRPIRLWEDYAKAIATELAADRLADSLNVVGRQQGEDVYSTLRNLRRRPKLSLCITTYNRAGWVEVNLRNIFRQRPQPSPDLEILVVDNTSIDRTAEAVQPFLNRRDFRYIRNPKNVGMLGNLAVTAQNARGDYIWILGDDDLTLPGAIDRILQIIEQHFGIGLIYMNYGYTSENNPAAVGDPPSFLNSYNTLEPACPDEFAPVKQLAAKCENFFSAIYSHVYRRDHAMKSYCQDTSGRMFSTMRSCIPTTFYVLNYMADESAYWIGHPSLVVNSNVSWVDYGTLFELEQLPRAWDLAERMGTDPGEVDRRRTNRLWLFEMMWKEIFEDDRAGNGLYFSAARSLMRLKHLPELAERVPKLLAIYERAHESGHPAAVMPAEVLFSAFSDVSHSVPVSNWAKAVPGENAVTGETQND